MHAYDIIWGCSDSGVRVCLYPLMLKLTNVADLLSLKYNSMATSQRTIRT